MDHNVRRLVVLMCVMLVAAAGMCALASAAYSGLNSYESPFTGSLPYGQTADPVTDTVVMFVVDGLRADYAPEMLSYRILATSGSSALAVCEVPSLSLPAVATFGTGASHEVHGIASNEARGEVTLDSLFASARRAGMETTVISSGSWERLFGADIDRSIVVRGTAAIRDAVAAEKAMEVLGDLPVGLIIVHFDQVDEAGHEFGAYHYKYRAAMINVDYLILDILSVIDLTEVTVVLVSDHGHTARGGHGGREYEVVTTPLVMTGRGTQRAGHEPVRHVDIAPTIAALLGLSTPAHVQGRILTEFITDLDQTALRNSVQAAALFTSMYGDAVGAETSPVAGVNVQAVSSPGEYEKVMGELETLRDSFRESFATSRRLARVMPGLAVIIAALFIARPGLVRFRWWTVAIIGVYQLVFLSVFWLRGAVFSPSLFNSYEQAVGFFVWRLVEGVIIAAVITGVMLLRVSLRSRVDAAAAAVECISLIWLSLVVQGVVYYIAQGLEFYAVLPDVNWGMKFFVDLAQMVGLALAAPLVAVSAAIIVPRVGKLVVQGKG